MESAIASETAIGRDGFPFARKHHVNGDWDHDFDFVLAGVLAAANLEPEPESAPPW